MTYSWYYKSQVLLDHDARADKLMLMMQQLVSTAMSTASLWDVGYTLNNDCGIYGKKPTKFLQYFMHPYHT